MKEYTLSPKYQGLQNYVFAYNSSTSSVPEIFNEDFSIIIYPNPASSILNVKTNNLDIQFCEIHSLDGKVLYKSDSIGPIDVNELKTGIYIISFFNGDGSLIETYKFLKQ